MHTHVCTYIHIHKDFAIALLGSERVGCMSFGILTVAPIRGRHVVTPQPLQEHVNEIHGAWFDPSNPVVPWLRDDRVQD